MQSGWTDKGVGKLCRFKLFSTLLDKAFLANYEAKRTQDDKTIHFPMYYINVLCSIKVDIGRDVGKTQQIVNRCLPGDVIMCTNEAMKRYTIDLMRESGKNPDNYVIVHNPPHGTDFAECIHQFDFARKLANFVFPNKEKSITVWCDDSSHSANYRSLINQNNCQYLYDNYETIRVVHLG